MYVSNIVTVKSRKFKMFQCVKEPASPRSSSMFFLSRNTLEQGIVFWTFTGCKSIARNHVLVGGLEICPRMYFGRLTPGCSWTLGSHFWTSTSPHWRRLSIFRNLHLAPLLLNLTVCCHLHCRLYNVE